MALPIASAGKGLRKGGTTCAACGIVLTLVEEGNGAIDFLEKPCGSNAECKAIVKTVLELVEQHVPPGEICAKIGLCDEQCKLFPEGSWPVKNLPPHPHDDPPNVGSFEERKMTMIKENKKNNESFFSLAESLAVSMGAVDDEVLKKKAEANALAVLEARTAHPCGSNFTCMVERFARDHLPISDVDGDGFSTASSWTSWVPLARCRL